LDLSNRVARRITALRSRTVRHIACTAQARRDFMFRFMVAALFVLSTVSRAHATLTPVSNFGSNPGALNMYEYVPQGLPQGRPLVVVLHG
jgi:poly(3-hydroxybutyrate) depolymerase